MSFADDLKKKLKEVGSFVVMMLLRWLLERLMDKKDEEKKDVDSSE